MESPLRQVNRIMFLGNNMKLEITEASIDEKSVVQSMMELYQHDFSEFDGGDLNDHGYFGYKYLDHYWTEKDKTPLIVRFVGKLTGFVLVNTHSSSAGARFCIAEFFILRKYRRKGIGKKVAHKVLDMFGPLWEVRQTKENTVAHSFWRSVVDEYTNGDYNLLENGLGDWDGPILIFNKKPET